MKYSGSTKFQIIKCRKTLLTKCRTYRDTGWPKSNVSKVRAYCSASDHLIRKIFSGVCRDRHWFEEYLKFIEIDDYFYCFPTCSLQVSSWVGLPIESANGHL